MHDGRLRQPRQGAAPRRTGPPARENLTMLVFVLKRAFWTIPVLVVCVTLVFGLMQAAARSPLRHAPPLGLSNAPVVKYGDRQPEGIERNQRRIFGLDAPWYEQYARYLASVARFDFGQTFTFRNRTVNSILWEHGAVTLVLVLLAVGWAAAFGVPLAVLAALHPGSLVDRATTVLVGVTLGLPNFFVATILLWVFGVELELVPTFGWEGWRAKVLPSVVLALVPLSLIVRVLRGQMVELLAQDHVQTARGKGLRRRRIAAVHLLRPALIPIVSMSGPLLGHLVTGLFIVEFVFAIPGVGRYFIAAAGVGDYPLTLGLTVVLTLAIVVTNTIADIAVAALDPRVRDA